ncbi:MAG: pentapeptide repeat-containing protein [Geminicoccaceae bacterium]
MPRPPRLLLAAAVLLGLGQAADAACTDAAAPAAQWRRCLLDGADLSGANLAGADLRDSSFKRSEMRGAILTTVQGRRAKFVSSGLQDVDFSGADLVQADFTSADLTGAKLVGASLRSARLFQANLRGADLTDAVLEGADLLRTDFSGARWVDGRTICAEGSIDRCHPGPGTVDSKVQG